MTAGEPDDKEDPAYAAEEPPAGGNRRRRPGSNDSDDTDDRGDRNGRDDCEDSDERVGATVEDGDEPDPHAEERASDDQEGRDGDTESEPQSEGDAGRTAATGPLPPAEMDRIFSLLERAVGSNALDGQQYDRLLSVLERAITGPSEPNPETLAELVEILEDLVAHPDDVEVDAVLSVLEEAIAGTTPIDGAHLEGVFDVIRKGMEDPSGIDSEDVERFRAGIEGAMGDVTDPASVGLEWLAPFFGPDGADQEEIEDGEVRHRYRIARIAAGLTRRATGYSLEAGLRTGTRMTYAAVTAESAAELLNEARAIALDELQLAGIDVGDEQVDWLESQRAEATDRRPLTRQALRERGERILSRSAEVGRDETLHPAYPFILDELAADEARILRLLATEGSKATIDVHDKGIIPFRSRLVAVNLTLVGSDAGCRHPDRTQIYIQNLERLGLVTFSDDPIDDLKRYQVLEAQSHVEAAREAAARPTLSYGSIHLSDLGVDFCETCMPFEVDVDGPASRFRRTTEEDQ